MIRELGVIFRQFPYFKGKHRLARLLLGKALNSVKDLEINGKYNCRYLLPNLSEIIGFELYINGVFEEEIIEFIHKQLPINGIFLDLGTNIGSIALPVCKMRPDVQVIGVEASPFVLKYLEDNIAMNGITNCKIYAAAVSDRPGQLIDFFTPVKQFGKGAVTDLFGGESDKVFSITIDEIVNNENLKRVDFIKMDIEGYEYFAFKGGAELFNRPDAPNLLFEFVDYAESAVPGLKAGDAQRLLLDCGYKLYHFINGSLVELPNPVENGFAMIFASKNYAR